MWFSSPKMLGSKLKAVAWHVGYAIPLNEIADQRFFPHAVKRG